MSVKKLEKVLERIRQAADCGKYRQAAGASAEAVNLDRKQVQLGNRRWPLDRTVRRVVGTLDVLSFSYHMEQS